MARVSHSLLDPYLLSLVPRLYRLAHIPAKFPPEGIVVTGHLIAIGGAFAIAWSTTYWWAGVLAGLAIMGNHLADMIDGTHARMTDQCRNGGELLDHFCDPLSFSYWIIGIAVSAGNLPLGLAGVLGIYATAVLTNIKAKITGEFTLARFGPTEFKALLAVYGVAMALVTAFVPREWVAPVRVAHIWLWVLIVFGLGHLLIQIPKTMRQVNSHGAAPDTTPWQYQQRAKQTGSRASSE